MNDLYIENTAVARTSCEAITAGVVYYQNLVLELKNARIEIIQNWDGDRADLTQTLTRIELVTSIFETTLIPSLQNLSVTVSDFADRVDELAANNAGNDETSGLPFGVDDFVGPPAPPPTTTPSGVTLLNSGNPMVVLADYMYKKGYSEKNFETVMSVVQNLKDNNMVSDDNMSELLGVIAGLDWSANGSTGDFDKFDWGTSALEQQLEWESWNDDSGWDQEEVGHF